jgi:iron complex outermembrane recepter protein
MKQKTMLASAVAAALVLYSWGACAQDAAPAQTAPADSSKAKSLETVTVTGSHIRSVDVETSQPVFTMDRAAIKATGLTNVSDILARMPSVGTPDITPQDTLASGPDVGGTYVDLRYLGSQRTLVLVNGRRWSTSLSGMTDLSTIPVAMIERIDVLKDGASSVYGSDAIGGVVNIITRENFNGGEVNVYFGENGQGDGQQKNADFTWGHHTEKNSFIISAAYQDLSPVWDERRDLTKYADGPRHPGDGWGLGPWGRVTDPRAEGTPGAGAYEDGAWVPNQYVINHGNTNTGDLANYHRYDPSSLADKYRSSKDMTFRAGSKLKNLYLQDSYKLTDNITLRGSATYSTRDSSSQLAGYPFSTDATDLVIDPANAYNPFPGYPTAFARRTVEMPRITWSNSRLAHVDVGAEGFFNFLNHDWNWDVGYVFSQTHIRQITTGNIYLPNAEKALGPTTTLNGQVVCASAADRAAGCVPWNVLAGPGGTPSSVWNYLNAVGTARQFAQTDDITANVGGGLFDLPAGTVNIAGGIEHRREKGSYHPDPADSAGLTTNLASAPTNGRYDVNEAYLELDVPVLRDLPGAQEFGVNVASRYSHYSDFGSTVNNKYSVRWRPIEDLLIRGTYAEGFRAPTINDLYGGVGQSFETFLDPCDTAFGAAASNATVAARCAAAGVPANYRQKDQAGNAITSNAGGQSATAFLSGSNPQLKPETSVTRTFGLVYSPHFVDGLDFTLDYYDIRMKNAISTVNASSILTYCYVQNVSDFCNRFTRDGSGVITSLNESLANLGSINTEGYDFGIHYRLPETPYGSFRIASDSTYLSKYDTTSGPGQPVNALAGFMKYQDGLNALYRIRSNLQLDWNYKQFGASWTMRYYSGLKDSCWSSSVECSDPSYTNPWIGSFGIAQKGSVTFNDVQLRYTAPWKGTFSLGVNNLFDKKGPFYYNVTLSGTGSPPYNPGFDYDRYFYVSYNQKF